MNSMKINKIGVVGAGTMGNGIAHVSALSEYETILMDIKDEFVENGFSTIQKNLNRQVEKDIIAQSTMDSAVERIKLTTEYMQLSDCDLIIEAATENQEIKLNIFKDLDNICKAETILASNTSSISINTIASATKRPENVIGMHFMNPVPVMKLVEIVKGSKTNESITKCIAQLSEQMGKIPVECNDSPGFVSNRILMPMINEAIFCLDEGVGTPEAIDTIMKLGMAHPMGPLTLADLIGLDVCLDIINVLYSDFKADKYRPCPLLVRMVENGDLGRKTGKGFYNYNT